MAEGGLKVLLLERGGERVEASKTLMGAVDALSDKCAESLRSTDGVTVVAGNCMGGTSALDTAKPYGVNNKILMH
jgi:dienelactone hydrolase